jgi:hypothetical protein
MLFFVVVIGWMAFVLSGCGLTGIMNPEPTPDNRITQEQKLKLIELRKDIRSWAESCAGGIACGTYPNGNRADGDAMLWAGFLCLSGESQQCAAISMSVTDEGGLCRNPDCDREKNSSSRDMFTGFMMYMARTANIPLGKRVYDYVVENNLQLCTDAVDNRCLMIHPTYDAGWNTWAKVWRFHGQEPLAEMKKGEVIGGSITSMQAIFADTGYPRNLVVAQLLTHQYIGNWRIEYQAAADQLVEFQPANPVFRYVAQGPTKAVADIVLNKCPSEKPAANNDWAWQRDESEQAWNKSVGWDCIFMINLLLR